MIRDPPILVFILRDWLLVRHFPIDSIPAWIFGLPRFYNAPTSAPGAFLESFVDLFYDAIVAPPVLPKVCSLEEKVRFQSMDEDGCGEIADESDSDSDGEIDEKFLGRAASGLVNPRGASEDVLSTGASTRLRQFMQWVSPWFIAVAVQLPKEKRLGTFERWAGLMGYSEDDGGIISGLCDGAGLFDVKAEELTMFYAGESISQAGTSPTCARRHDCTILLLLIRPHDV